MTDDAPSMTQDAAEIKDDAAEIKDDASTLLTDGGLEPINTAEASGASDVFGIGDEIQVGQITFVLRAPTNPELGLYADISERHQFEQVTAEAANLLGEMEGNTSAQAEVLQQKQVQFQIERTRIMQRDADGKATKRDNDRLLQMAKRVDELSYDVSFASAKTRRERFYFQKIKALEKRVTPLENKSIAGKATPDEENELLGVLTEMDELHALAKQVQLQDRAKLLLALERIYSTADAVYSELTWHIARADGVFNGNLEEWRLITKNNREALEDLVESMGFRNPLSGLSRRGAPRSGGSGTSRRSRQASLRKTGGNSQHGK